MAGIVSLGLPLPSQPCPHPPGGKSGLGTGSREPCWGRSGSLFSNNLCNFLKLRKIPGYLVAKRVTTHVANTCCSRMSWVYTGFSCAHTISTEPSTWFEGSPRSSPSPHMPGLICMHPISSYSRKSSRRKISEPLSLVPITPKDVGWMPPPRSLPVYLVLPSPPAPIAFSDAFSWLASFQIPFAFSIRNTQVSSSKFWILTHSQLDLQALWRQELVWYLVPPQTSVLLTWLQNSRRFYSSLCPSLKSPGSLKRTW